MARLTTTTAPPVLRLASVDSTQRYAAELARSGAPDRTVVIADTQTAGRGRRGRTWHDAPGASLLVSIVTRPSLTPAQLPTLSLAAGVAVIDALAAVGVTARLKWPNDALVNGRKIAGVLLERHGDAVVLGIGINLQHAAIPATVAAHATSVAGEGGHADGEALLQALRAALDRWRATLEGEGFDAVRARWSEVSETLGRRVAVDGITGTAVGIDHDGALLVATEAGTARVLAGDVGVG